MKLLKLKTLLKLWAIEIRSLKNSRKQDKREGRSLWEIECDVKGLKYEIRHHHIAYCELRGTERERIERKCLIHPSESYITKIKDKYREDILEISDETIRASA